MMKYFIKGTVSGTEEIEGDRSSLDAESLVADYNDIKNLFVEDNELAQYLDDNSIIYKVVTKILVDVEVSDKKLFSITEVHSIRPLSDTEKKCLLSYLEGQFSDGYGEGLEQFPYKNWVEDISYEEEDADGETYTDTYPANCHSYLHLWSRDNFHLYFNREEEENSLIGTVNAGFTIIEQGAIAVIGRRRLGEYVAWSYTLKEDGTTSYYWGRYGSLERVAECFEKKEKGIYSGD